MKESSGFTCAQRESADLKSGDFTTYQTNATAWLGQKIPDGAPNTIADAARAGLFKDPVLANTLDQRQLIALCGADKLGAFAKAAPANQTFLSGLLTSQPSYPPACFRRGAVQKNAP